MLRGLYTAASGMLTQQRKTEMLTNNMANANTPGFKAEQSSVRAFPEMLLHSMGSSKLPVKNGRNIPYSNVIGSLNTGVYLQETIPSLTQGDIRETGNNTDLALVNGLLPEGQGSLFFTVQNEAGDTRYTRNGNFTVDGQGYLTTNEGYYVLSSEGNRIQVNRSDFQVRADGTITIAEENIGQLGIAFAADPSNLLKDGTGLFRTVENENLAMANNNENVNFSLHQGFLEGSNVDLTKSMTEMMTAYRAFEANQKVLQAYDASLDKAVNQVGRIG